MEKVSVIGEPSRNGRRWMPFAQVAISLMVALTVCGWGNGKWEMESWCRWTGKNLALERKDTPRRDRVDNGKLLRTAEY